MSAEEIIQRFRDLINRSFQTNKLHISYDQYMVVSSIYKNQGITQSKVAEATRKEPASISRIVKLLENKGMIERIPDRSNRRAKRLYLTPYGGEVHGKATRLFNLIAKNGFDGVYEQEINLFVRILEKLQNNFQPKKEEDA